jgi:hypothetical protein
MVRAVSRGLETLMKITYHGPIDAVELAETGQIVERGGTVDVPDELGLSLIEQSTFDTTPKTLLAAVGRDLDLAARMLRAELDGARRAEVVRPLEKLLKVDDPAELEQEPATTDSAPTTATTTTEEG